jgi:hypothetical protein
MIIKMKKESEGKILIKDKDAVLEIGKEMRLNGTNPSVLRNLISLYSQIGLIKMKIL